MGDFTQLLAELDSLQELRKAHAEPDGDEGPDGKEPADNPDEEQDEVENPEDDEQIEAASEEDEDEPMGKSLLLASGETIEYLDGTALVKALTDRVDTQDEALAKALASTTDLIKSLHSEIDGLKADVQRMASAGRGRKTVVSLAETAAPVAAPVGVSADDFMVKALNAQKAGRLTALQVSVAEGYLQRGLDIPDPIKTLVFEG